MTDQPIPRMPSFRLEGRRAVVTGAGRGLGRACAHALAEAGAHVIAVARSADELAALVAEITAAGGSAEAAPCDVMDMAALAALFDDRPAAHVLVNNAGTNNPMPAFDVTVDDFDLIMELNVRAAFFVAQAAARAMVRDGTGGSIINMSSQMAHVGGPRRAVYCASKHAVEGFTKVMAAEWAEHGIRVNTICPTFVETPMTKPFLSEPGFKETVEQAILLGRVGQVEDVMGAVVYLASDASALVTGAPLMLDGGWTAV
ncbi:MAG: SDR family oxidoreductase [Pseudomonadota bacterium]|nr:SDR family oxidoreductase [Pseudomonadota bacterium]